MYRAADHDAIVRLWDRVFADDPPWNAPADLIRIKRGVQPELFFVCELDGAVVGTAVAGFEGVRGWVHKVAADPDQRRSGIASHLMAVVEDGLRSAGCPKLNLQVRAGNDAAVAFYKAAGYAIEDRVSMGKRL
tara:strand:+ start:3156 stop:3554 length:399 start_codon:yes stop_codon:yes gene_type:complete